MVLPINVGNSMERLCNKWWVYKGNRNYKKTINNNLFGTHSDKRRLGEIYLTLDTSKGKEKSSE